MANKEVSVIIPVYNIREYIGGCIESVINQTYRDMEIILVDDGASDGSGEICDEYAAKDERIRVIHKENGGLISAWSEGVKAANGRYALFIDGDDWVETNMIEELLKYVSKEPGIREIISSNYIIEKKNEKRKATQGLAPGVYENEALDSVRKRLLGEENRPVTMSRCMKLISRELILDNLHYLNFNLRMAEDVNITLPCLLDADRLTVVEDGYFYHYRTVGESMSHGHDKRLLADIKMIYKTFLDIMKDKGVSNAVEQMDREYVRLLFLVMKSELRINAPDVTGRVKEVFGKGEVADIIKNTPVTVSEKGNKLIYLCMRHPITPVILGVRMIIKGFDRVTMGAH
ncbi:MULTISPECIES: glycosyltransferase family 2 protein [unclassified Butyrivibrio]|uniref:glycosyltransferase family 2 protein n=1 Tax=unclassified Butyrivibrio TaxID=2639466 RepID=UPI000426B535|nr:MULTISPECIES: glycosyltransferase family 2 protein [unclassified Butyrivibrio]